MELLFIAGAAAIIIFLVKLFVRMPMIYIIIILAIAGFKLANAADIPYAEAQCRKISQLVCKDVIRTYQTNEDRNLTVIKRAEVLQVLYIEMECPPVAISGCITENLGIELEK